MEHFQDHQHQDRQNLDIVVDILHLDLRQYHILVRCHLADSLGLLVPLCQSLLYQVSLLLLPLGT